MKKYYFEQTSYYEIEAENEARAKQLVEFTSPVDYSEMLLTDVEEQERDFNNLEKTISNAKNKSSQQINTKCNSKEIERG